MQEQAGLRHTQLRACAASPMGQENELPRHQPILRRLRAAFAARGQGEAILRADVAPRASEKPNLIQELARMLHCSAYII